MFRIKQIPYMPGQKNSYLFSVILYAYLACTGFFQSKDVPEGIKLTLTVLLQNSRPLYMIYHLQFGGRAVFQVSKHKIKTAFLTALCNMFNILLALINFTAVHRTVVVIVIIIILSICIYIII